MSDFAGIRAGSFYIFAHPRIASAMEERFGGSPNFGASCLRVIV